MKPFPRILFCLAFILFFCACQLVTGAPTLTSEPIPSATTAPKTIVKPTLTPTVIPSPSEVVEPLWMEKQYDTQAWYSQELTKDSKIWGRGINQFRHFHGGSSLISAMIPGCIISIEHGHGMPDDWTYDDGYTENGDVMMDKRSFYERAKPQEIVFIVYEGTFLVNFPIEKSEQIKCIQAVEQVLLGK
jgi:hypothetical protein